MAGLNCRVLVRGYWSYACVHADINRYLKPLGAQATAFASLPFFLVAQSPYQAIPFLYPWFLPPCPGMYQYQACQPRANSAAAGPFFKPVNLRCR
eukprot:scaffold67451_cov21-Tisochrysis_lutea.AAC.1